MTLARGVMHTFDPLRPTKEEETEMIQGYKDGLKFIDPVSQTPAYLCGYKNGTNDAFGIETIEARRDAYSIMMIQIRLDHIIH